MCRKTQVSVAFINSEAAPFDTFTAVWLNLYTLEMHNLHVK